MEETLLEELSYLKTWDYSLALNWCVMKGMRHETEDMGVYLLHALSLLNKKNAYTLQFHHQRTLLKKKFVFPFWTIHFWGTKNRWYFSIPNAYYYSIKSPEFEILCTQPTGRGHYYRSGIILRVLCKFVSPFQYPFERSVMHYLF